MDVIIVFLCIYVFVLSFNYLLMCAWNSMYECGVKGQTRIFKIITIVCPGGAIICPGGAIVCPGGGCQATSHCLKRCVVSQPSPSILYINYYWIDRLYGNMLHCLKRSMQKYRHAIEIFYLGIFKLRIGVLRNIIIQFKVQYIVQCEIIGGTLISESTFKNIKFWINTH